MTNKTLRVKTPEGEYIAEVNNMEQHKDLLWQGGNVSKKQEVYEFEISELHEANGNNVVE